MANDLIQCPLCDGLSRIPRAQLIHALSDPEVFSKIGRLLAELRVGSDLHPEAVAVAAGTSDFETQVHGWNPSNPMWKRSPKE